MQSLFGKFALDFVLKAVPCYSADYQAAHHITRTTRSQRAPIFDGQHGVR